MGGAAAREPAPCCSTACRWPAKRRRPPLPLRALARKGVFYALLAAIVLGGAAEVTMAQWASAFGKKTCSCQSWRATCGRVLFSLMLALGRSGYAALGARVPLHRLLIGGSGAAAVLYVVCALAPSPLLGVLACGLTGLLRQPAVAGRDHSCVRRIPPRGGHVRAAFRGRRCGRVPGGVLRGPRGGLGAGVRHGVCGGCGESGALRAGLLLAAVFPLLCCGVHTALHCSEARGRLAARGERRHGQ